MRSAEDLDVELAQSPHSGLQPRLVLCPHGMPRREEARELSMQLLKRFGGDLERIIESGSASLEHFVHYVSRIARIRECQERPLILLTRTHPLGLFVERTRRTIESKVPFLTTALWVIFCDLEEDPFFVEAARLLGTLEHDIAQAPIWTGRDGRRFLVWTTETTTSEQPGARPSQPSSGGR